MLRVYYFCVEKIAYNKINTLVYFFDCIRIPEYVNTVIDSGK